VNSHQSNTLLTHVSLSQGSFHRNHVSIIADERKARLFPIYVCIRTWRAGVSAVMELILLLTVQLVVDSLHTFVPYEALVEDLKRLNRPPVSGVLA
jgi:hypothetical protein